MPSATHSNPSGITSVCVYCGSSAGRDPVFADSARAMGQLLAESGIRLVYGGGAVGLMGILADTVMQAGGSVTGIIPAGLFSKEVGHVDISELIEVDSMHARKLRMFEESDAFIALPGGFGTLEELTEMLTWQQIGIHAKPIGVLNVSGFYDLLLAQFDQMVRAGLLKESNRELVHSHAEPPALLDMLRRAEPVYEPKWLELDQT